MRALIVILFSLGLTPVGPALSLAQDPIGDAFAGRRLAQGWCSACHAGDPVTSEPLMAAPSFAEIAKRRGTTSFRIRAFLRSSHTRMPNYILTPDEIDDIAAYIISLRRGRS